MSARTRRVASIALAVLGCLLALVGGIAFYLREEVFDSDAFADNAAESLKDQKVEEALADPIVDQTIDNGPDVLINARPLLLSATEGVLGSSPFRAVFRKGARKVHKAVFSKDRDEIALTLANADVLIADAVSARSPKLGRKIPRDVGNRLVALSENETVLAVVRVSEDVKVLGLLLPLLAILSLGGSVAVAVDRRRALLIASSGVAIAALLGFFLFLIARGFVLSQFDDDTVHTAVAAVWGAFFGGLRTWFLSLGFIAILLAAAAAMARERDPIAPARRALAFVTRTPANPWARAGRAVAVGAVSLLFVLQPTLALQIVAVTIGAYGLFFASCELLGLIGPPPDRERIRRALPSARVLVGGAALLAVVVIAVVALVTGGDEGEREIARPPGEVVNCNGFPELCDRPLNEVAFPAAHNAMSAAELPGWYQPNQRNDIRAQLDDGIRAFLIDSHYGVKRSSGPVLTDLEREGSSKVLEGITAELGTEAAAAFQQIQAQYAHRGGEGKPGSYFCHVVCELGSIEMGQTLGWFRDFLQSHPDEVVILFIEDKVSPTDTAAAFEKSGILPYAYIHKPGEGFPTMRELIETDKRLFVMAEVDAGGGAIPWYHPGFELAMETPYTFKSAEELASPASCAKNRGGTGKPLFQLNHWVEKVPRSPSTAATVNDFDFLLQRASRCDRAPRRRRPQYRRGRLLQQGRRRRRHRGAERAGPGREAELPDRGLDGEAGDDHLRGDRGDCPDHAQPARSRQWDHPRDAAGACRLRRAGQPRSRRPRDRPRRQRQRLLRRLRPRRLGRGKDGGSLESGRSRGVTARPSWFRCATTTRRAPGTRWSTTR